MRRYALVFGGEQPDVTGVLAVYPFTAWIDNVDAVIGRFQVPLTVLAAGADTYGNCCLIDKAREIEKVAKAKGKAFEMVVYENAEHPYDLTGRNYRSDYARDTRKRTEEWLKRGRADTGKYKCAVEKSSRPIYLRSPSVASV